jgi:hypothetical protein
MNTSTVTVDVTVEACFYCNQEVEETDTKFCCMWSEYFSYTGLEDFTSKNFKQMVSGNYKIKRTCKSKKRTSIKYDPTSLHLHTEELGAITLK